MGDLPQGTVTFLFTDLEGSTRLWEETPEATGEALARHDVLVEQAVESHSGVVFSRMGDGMAAAFVSAPEAIAAAVDAQHSLCSASWGATGPLRVRMGLHTGEGVLVGEQYANQPLNRCARLMAVAHGGQVLISGATEALARDRLPEKVQLVDLGEHRLRDLARPMRVFQVTHTELASGFPPLRTLDAFPGNLPLQVSSFVGRARELERTAAALEDGRVVTLTGVGGVGKTRLAMQVAAEVLPRFREGAWLVELAPIRDLEGVPGALAAVFGVSARSEMTLEESLAEFLRTKQLLMILDNCEHLLEPVAELVEFLERDCAGLVFLATSREGLAVEGERVLPVPSLPGPPPDAGPDDAGRADAVRLFVERARGVDPDFALTVENTAAVIQICRRLDGVPLAIELAAAHVSAMSPAELAQGLERRFDTLAGGRRRAVQRHQTLRAAIDWSYDLLSYDERRLLARLAVFAGGCTRQAAEAVCGAEPLIPGRVFALLAALVTKSLVVAQRDGPETRYRLLETIREYGEDRLAEYGETEVLRTGHAEYFCQLALDLHQEVFGPRQVMAGRRLAAEYENLLAAMNHAIDIDNVDVALRLVHNTPLPPEQVGYRLLLPVDAALRLPGAADHPLYPFVLAAAALGAASRGDLARTEAACEEALTAGRSLDSDRDRLVVERVVRSARATQAIAMGAWDEAAEHMEQSRKLPYSRDAPPVFGLPFSGAAIAYTMAGNPDAAVAVANEGVDVARRSGAPMYIVVNLAALAGALADRDPERARALLAESLELRATLDFESPWHATQCTLVAARMADWSLVLKLGSEAIRHLHWAGDRPFLGGILNTVARALVPTQPESAAVLQGTARRLVPTQAFTPRSRDAVSPRAPSPGTGALGGASFVTELRRQTTAAIRDNLGEARLHQLRAEGEAMDDDRAVAYALDAIARVERDESPSP